MSDENLKLQSIHPFISSQSKLTKNCKYNGIDVHSGILISIAEKGLNFYEMSEYEKKCENSTLKPNKLVDNNFFLNISVENKYSWLEYNCDGSLLLAAILHDNQSLSMIKIIDIEKTINNFEETLFCQYKPHAQCILNDLKWHPNDKNSFLMVLNDVVHLCTTKQNEVIIINSKPNAFCVSWSPKGKQFSVVMKNETTGRFLLNQYDNLMTEKRSTEIGDVQTEFKVTFPLIPVDLCWYSTFSCIIGFRGSTQTSDQYRIFPCNFAIKTSKIDILCEAISSNECVSPSPGPLARLHTLHILEWSSIVLINNSAENAVIYEYDANNKLSVVATYCLPMDGNVTGLGCDFTSTRQFPGNVSLPAENINQHPMLLVQLSNGQCFGIYMLHNTKKIDRIFGKTKIPHTNLNCVSRTPFSDTMATNRQDMSSVVSDNSTKINIFGTTQSSNDVTKNLFGKQTAQLPSLFGASKIEEPSKTSIFGTPKPNEPIKNSLFGTTKLEEPSKMNIFGTAKPEETSKTNLFGTAKPEQPSKTNLFGTTISEQPSKTNLFGNTKSEQPSKTNIFGTVKPEEQNSIFRNDKSEEATKTSLFGSSKPNESIKNNLFETTKSIESSKTGLFGTTKPEESNKTNLFGTTKEHVKTNIFSAQNIETSKSTLFGTQKPEEPTRTNLFGSTRSDNTPKTNIFGVSKTENPPLTNIFGSAKQENTSKTNLFGISNQETTQTNMFGTQIQDAKSISNVFGTHGQESQNITNVFGIPKPDNVLVSSPFEGPKLQSSGMPKNQDNLAQSVPIKTSQPDGQKPLLKPTKTTQEPLKPNPLEATTNHISNKTPTVSGKSSAKEDWGKLITPKGTPMTASESKSSLTATHVNAVDIKPKDKPDVYKLIPVNINRKFASGDSENLDKLTVDSRKDKQLAKPSPSTDFKSTTVVDQFLPDALKSLKERFNSIKTSTEGLISKSKIFFSSDLMTETVPKMFKDVECQYANVKGIDSSNQNSVTKSKSIFQDINITIEFTTRFKSTIADYKNHNKNPKPTPNPLLKKTSLNLDELMKKVNFHLKDLEDSLDDNDLKRKNNSTSINTSKVIENITQTIQSHEVSISIERSKIDLLKEHLHNLNANSRNNLQLHKKLLSCPNQFVNRAMEKHLHSLLSRRTVRNLSCKISENKLVIAIDTKKTFKTPTRHSNINRTSIESIQYTEQQKAIPSSVSSKSIDKSGSLSAKKDNSNTLQASPNKPVSGNIGNIQQKPIISNTFLKPSEVDKSRLSNIKPDQEYLQRTDSTSTNRTSTTKPNLQASLKTYDTDKNKHEIVKGESVSLDTITDSIINENESKKQQSKFMFNSMKPLDLFGKSTKPGSFISPITGSESLFTSSDLSNISNNKPTLTSEASQLGSQKTTSINQSFSVLLSSSPALNPVPSQSPLNSVASNLSESDQSKKANNDSFAKITNQNPTATFKLPITTSQQTSVTSRQIRANEPIPSEFSFSPELTRMTESLTSSVEISQQPAISISNSVFPSKFASPNKSNTSILGINNISSIQSVTDTSSKSIIPDSTPNSDTIKSSSVLLRPSDNRDTKISTSQFSTIPLPTATVSEAVTSQNLSESEISGSISNTSVASSMTVTNVQSGGFLFTSPTVTNALSTDTLSTTTVSIKSDARLINETTSQPKSVLFGSANITNTQNNTGLLDLKTSASASASGPLGANVSKSDFVPVNSSTGLFSSLNIVNSQSNPTLIGSSKPVTTQSLPSSGISESPNSENAHSATGLFASSNTTPAQANIGLFGSPNKITSSAAGAGLFGSSNTQKVQSSIGSVGSPNSGIAQPSSGVFSSPNTSNKELFGSLNIQSTQPSTGLFGSPIAVNTPQSGVLFGSPNTESTQPNTVIFGSPITASTQSITGLFGSANTASTQSNTGLFGSPNIASTQSNTGLFGSSNTTSTQSNTGLFGSPNTASTQSNTGLFGSPNTASTQSNSGLFGSPNIASTQSNTGLFGSPNIASTQSNTGLFGSPNIASTQSNTGLFGSPNIVSTQSNTGLFGSPNTTSIQSNTGLFGSVNTASTQASTGLFGSPNTASTQSNTGLFGTGGTQASTGLFGSGGTQANKGLFGSTNTASTQSKSGFFGSVNAGSTQSNTGLFGSTNNQSSSGLFKSTNANNNQPSAGFFGSVNTASTQSNTGLFGSPNIVSTQSNTGIFGSPNTVSTQSNTGLFGSPNTAGIQSNTGLFGSQNTASTQSNTGLFGSPNTASTQSNTGLFGSPNTASTQSNTGLFGSQNTASTQSNTGLFGNNLTQSQQSSVFGSSSANKPSGSLFSNPSSLNTSGGLFGNASSTSNTSVYGSRNVFGNTSTQAAPTDTSSGSLFGSSFMSGLGSSTPAATTGNIFAAVNNNSNNTGTSNLFSANTQSNNSGSLFNSSNTGFNFGTKAPSPAQQQSSLFGSRPTLGNANTSLVQNNNTQSGSLFHNSIFGNSNDSQMTFGDMASGNENQSGFGMSSNNSINSGNIFQTVTSPSFTQRRM